MELYQELERRHAEGRPIAVGLVGCGQMGSGFVHATFTPSSGRGGIPGIETRAISDIDPQRAMDVYAALGIQRGQVTVTDSLADAEDALRRGQMVVTEDALLLAQLEGIDCVLEATGITEIGARVAWTSILHEKHVVMLNVETDVTVGLLLNRLAQRGGSVYTVSSGDEPGVCKMLHTFGRNLGFEVICLGKGKNNPLDPQANPDSCREEALSKGMNPKMLASFQDGTKTMVEMAAVSNATGLLPDVPGMHGPKVDLERLTEVFVPREDGGMFDIDMSDPHRRGRVDYSTGRVAPGVFAIVTSDEPRVRIDMGFLSMGCGPYYLLYRPFHLCNLETPIAIAEAVLHGRTTVVAEAMHSEVVAVAKRPLRAGETLDDVGGYTFYNRVYTYDEARQMRAIPMGLATGARVLRDVAQDAVLTSKDVAPDTERFVYKLRQMQDGSVL
jgi:predicted homoserine dehydrogenase-like protein